MPIRIQLVFAALLAGAAAGLWFGHDYVSDVLAAISSKQTEQVEKRASSGDGVPVVVAETGMQSNDISIAAISTARAKRFVTLFPKAAGQITRISVNAGDRVEQGQNILMLDSRDTELAVELAKVKISEAEVQLARAQQLLEGKVNSKAKVYDMRLMLERARLELEQSEQALADRTIEAPFAGIVGIAKVEAGDRVSTTTALITIDDRSSLLIEIEVPEQFLSEVKIGQAVNAITPSFPDRRFEGTVDKIDSRVDPTSRTVNIRASLPNPEDLLRPGMSFAAELNIPGKAYAAVPELALQWAKGESYIWRVRDGKAERVAVRSIKRLNRVILVDGDIREGDIVVVEGVQRLRPGRQVSFAQPEPSSGAGS